MGVENRPPSPSLERRLRAALAERGHADIEQLTLDDDLLEGLGLDSLGGLKLLAGVEKHFAVRLPDQRLAELTSLRALLRELEPLATQDGQATEDRP